MIVQYLSEYIVAMDGEASKIAEFEERYGYTPRPFLRDGINDSRYYQLSNKHSDEQSRYEAAVRLFAVVAREPKVAPPRGKQREVVKQWLLWLSVRQEYESAEELADLCRRQTGVDSRDTVESIINQNPELTLWRKASSGETENRPSKIADEATTPIANEATAPMAEDKEAEVDLLTNFKNRESYRNANAKDRKSMKKAFAKMTYEEKVLYFAEE